MEQLRSSARLAAKRERQHQHRAADVPSSARGAPAVGSTPAQSFPGATAATRAQQHGSAAAALLQQGVSGANDSGTAKPAFAQSAPPAAVAPLDMLATLAAGLSGAEARATAASTVKQPKQKDLRSRGADADCMGCG